MEGLDVDSELTGAFDHLVPVIRVGDHILVVKYSVVYLLEYKGYLLIDAFPGNGWGHSPRMDCGQGKVLID